VSHICDAAWTVTHMAPRVKPRCKCCHNRYCNACPSRCGIKSRW